MKPVLVHTVTKFDIGKNYFKKTVYGLPEGDEYYSDIHGNVSVHNLVGYFLKLDVGKRIYYVDGILQIENQEQLEKRLSK